MCLMPLYDNQADQLKSICKSVEERDLDVKLEWRLQLIFQIQNNRSGSVFIILIFGIRIITVLYFNVGYALPSNIYRSKYFIANCYGENFTHK